MNFLKVIEHFSNRKRVVNYPWTCANDATYQLFL